MRPAICRRSASLHPPLLGIFGGGGPFSFFSLRGKGEEGSGGWGGVAPGRERYTAPVCLSGCLVCFGPLQAAQPRSVRAGHFLWPLLRGMTKGCDPVGWRHWRRLACLEGGGVGVQRGWGKRGIAVLEPWVGPPAGLG